MVIYANNYRYINFLGDIMRGENLENFRHILYIEGKRARKRKQVT